MRWSDASPGATVSPPSACASELCRAPWALVDVAVDPSDPFGYFAICRGLTDGTHIPQHVVRGRVNADGAACEVVLDGSALPQGVAPIALAVSEP